MRKQDTIQKKDYIKLKEENEELKRQGKQNSD
jgi:hypothetical protein